MLWVSSSDWPQISGILRYLTVITKFHTFVNCYFTVGLIVYCSIIRKLQVSVQVIHNRTSVTHDANAKRQY